MNSSEAWRHHSARNWSEAERHFEAALAERKRSPVEAVELLVGLAEAQRAQAKLGAAEQTAGEALKLAIAERNQTLHSCALEEMANVQLDLGQFEQAERTTNEVIHLVSSGPKPDYARLASSSRKLAMALERNQRHADAVRVLNDSAAYAEKAFGPEHVETAMYLHELGMLHSSHGRHEEAQNFLRKALHIHRSVGGADSHEATQALQNLATVLEEAGNTEAAAAEYEKLLALRERQVGANPVETARAQVRLASLHLRSNRLASARELLMRAIPSVERRGGALHATALETMAQVEERSGREQAARQYRDKAIVAAALESVK